MAASSTTEAYTLADHPRAARSVETVRAWAALAALAIVVLVSVQAGVTVFDSIARGLAAGVVMFVIAWGVSVMVWREVLRAELVRLRDERIAQREEQKRAMEKALEADADDDEDLLTA